MFRVICLVCFAFVTLQSFVLVTSNIINRVGGKYGKETKNRFLLLKSIIDENRSSDDFKKLKAINSFFNQVTYSSDKAVWGRKDYWATPYEFLSKDRGDSEDFVFAKYFILVNDLKIDSKKFFFTYVKSLKKNVSYMVLTYYKSKKSMPYILDSINYKVLPANKRQDIAPIYSFSANSAGVGKRISSKFKNKQSAKFKTLIENIKKGKI